MKELEIPDMGRFSFVRDSSGIGGWVTLLNMGDLPPNTYVHSELGQTLTELAVARGMTEEHNFARRPPKVERKTSGKLSRPMVVSVGERMEGFNPFVDEETPAAPKTRKKSEKSSGGVSKMTGFSF